MGRAHNADMAEIYRPNSCGQSPNCIVTCQRKLQYMHCVLVRQDQEGIWTRSDRQSIFHIIISSLFSFCYLLTVFIGRESNLIIYLCYLCFFHLMTCLIHQYKISTMTPTTAQLPWYNRYHGTNIGCILVVVQWYAPSLVGFIVELSGELNLDRLPEVHENLSKVDQGLIIICLLTGSVKYQVTGFSMTNYYTSYFSWNLNERYRKSCS